MYVLLRSGRAHISLEKLMGFLHVIFTTEDVLSRRAFNYCPGEEFHTGDGSAPTGYGKGGSGVGEAPKKGVPVETQSLSLVQKKLHRFGKKIELLLLMIRSPRGAAGSRATRYILKLFRGVPMDLSKESSHVKYATGGF